MNPKSILAVASASADDFSLLSAGAKLASRWGAFLHVIPAFPDPAADYVAFGVALGRGGGEEAIIERVAAGEQQVQERIEALTRDASAMLPAESERPSFAVARRALAPAAEVSRAAVLADFVLFGGEAARGVLKGIVADALLAMRSPCLIVNSSIGFGPAAIAWDGRAEAGRAVRAALPLLQAASGVFIIRNTEDRRLDPQQADSEGLLEYLGRHGVRRARTVDVSGESVAESVLSAAMVRKCDLLVAGAYGRPRLYEMLFGGATRGLVNAEAAPSLLLAH